MASNSSTVSPAEALNGAIEHPLLKDVLRFSVASGKLATKMSVNEFYEKGPGSAGYPYALLKRAENVVANLNLDDSTPSQEGPALFLDFLNDNRRSWNTILVQPTLHWRRPSKELLKLARSQRDDQLWSDDRIALAVIEEAKVNLSGIDRRPNDPRADEIRAAMATFGLSDIVQSLEKP